VPGSDQTEGSDWISALSAQGVFLEDVGDIPLEFHQNQRPFLISRIVFLLRHRRVRNQQGCLHQQ
jgi:hypothetical protein